MIAALVLMLLAMQAAAPTPPGEDPVAPYAASNANAGAAPARGEKLLQAFHGRDGIGRIVVDFVARNQADPRIADIFRGQDMNRLRRTLVEQFCYLLGGGCQYSGRDMAAAHKDLGIQAKDMNALVENLQAAMAHEGVAFAAQNAFLAKLAPMKRDVVSR
jgi:hemoglobin